MMSIDSVFSRPARITILSFLFLCLLPIGVRADTEYRIGPGDLLEIVVWDEPDLSGTFLVSREGTIAHPLLEAFPAAGRTLIELNHAFTAALAKDYLVDPRVQITIKAYHKRKILVFGAVRQPGRYELQKDASLLRLMLECGGITEDAKDAARIVRTKQVGKNADAHKEQVVQLEVNIRRLLDKGDISQNVELHDGDIVFVERFGGNDFENDKCYVLGEVKNPGAFKVVKGFTVLSAIVQAGGFTEFASPNKTKLIRGSGKEKIERTLKLKRLWNNGDQRDNIELQPGDIIIVPQGFF
ncbi:MAG: hypothetical protein D6795_06525 [Deltaproteobacteria bacterium]|nr:MAG: hypothetical protein D6795_06525 [Deltaproteobacteria bacterium]